MVITRKAELVKDSWLRYLVTKTMGPPKTLGGSFHIKHKTDAQLDFLKGLSTIKNSKIHIKIMNMYEFYIQTATMNCRIW